MFSTNLTKICCSFVQNNFFEKSKMAVKMADMTVVTERNKANPKPLAGQSLIFYELPFGKSMWGGSK